MRLRCLAAFTGLLNLIAAAQNPPKPPAPLTATAPTDPPRWETIASAGLTLTKGNSDTLLANFGVTTAKKTLVSEISLSASLTYGEASGVKNVDNYNADAQYNHLVSERFYTGFKLAAAKDDIANLAYRLTLSPLVGYYFIKTAATQFSAETGPSYLVEQLGGFSRSYAAFRVGERFEHKFNDRAKVWEVAEIIPQVDRFSQYLINFELGVSSAITARTSLRAVLQDTYNSQAAAGRKANDIRIVTGIGYKF